MDLNDLNEKLTAIRDTCGPAIVVNFWTPKTGDPKGDLRTFQNLSFSSHTQTVDIHLQ